MPKQDLFGGEEKIEVVTKQLTKANSMRLEELVAESMTSVKRLRKKRKQADAEKKHYEKLLEYIYQMQMRLISDKRVEQYHSRLEEMLPNVPFDVMLKYFSTKLENDAKYHQELENQARMARKRDLEELLGDRFQDDEAKCTKCKKTIKPSYQ